ncbi:MAG: hypothetical protein R3D80_16250 [Paracoccaceae bacterium]
MLIGFQVGALRHDGCRNSSQVLFGMVYVILGLAFFLFGLELWRCFRSARKRRAS